MLDRKSLIKAFLNFILAMSALRKYSRRTKKKQVNENNIIKFMSMLFPIIFKIGIINNMITKKEDINSNPKAFR